MQEESKFTDPQVEEKFKEQKEGMYVATASSPSQTEGRGDEVEAVRLWKALEAMAGRLTFSPGEQLKLRCYNEDFCYFVENELGR